MRAIREMRRDDIAPQFQREKKCYFSARIYVLHKEQEYPYNNLINDKL